MEELKRTLERHAKVRQAWFNPTTPTPHGSGSASVSLKTESLQVDDAMIRTLAEAHGFTVRRFKGTKAAGLRIVELEHTAPQVHVQISDSHAKGYGDIQITDTKDSETLTPAQRQNLQKFVQALLK